MAADRPQQVRCLLLPLAAGPGILIPNGLVAEIVTQQAVEPVRDAPPWLLGTGSWRGIDVPLIAFEALAGFGDSNPEPGGRYVVLFSLEPERTPRYYGIRIQALPRSETVSDERLTTLDRSGEDPPVVVVRGQLGERDCAVPDLDRLTAEIRSALDRESASTPSESG